MGDHDGLESVITIGWNAQWMIWLLRTGASRRDLSRPNNITREPGNRSGPKVQK
jgi:hypothetical protein